MSVRCGLVATKGKETYGGGRYLELYLPINAHTELDFNRAYNPLCASVTAGEKAYAGKH